MRHRNTEMWLTLLQFTVLASDLTPLHVTATKDYIQSKLEKKFLFFLGEALSNLIIYT